MLTVFTTVGHKFTSSEKTMHIKLNSSKYFLLTFVSFLFLANSSFAQDDITTMQINDSLELGNLAMKNVGGGTQTIDQNMSKNGVVVIFSCNTCPFVVGSESFSGWEKTYNSVYKEAKEQGFGVVLVNANEAKRDGDDSFEKMEERAKAQGYQMPYLVDENSTLANALGAKTTPHVFVFNTENKLVYTGAIDNSVDSKRKEDKAYLINALKELAAKKAVSEASTPPRGCSIKRKSVSNKKQ